MTRVDAPAPVGSSGDGCTRRSRRPRLTAVVAQPSVRLRPVREDDFWLFERNAGSPDAVGEFNWSGYRDVAALHRQYEVNRLIGPDAGRLVVVLDEDVVGDVSWTKVTYGTPSWWCWNIGVSLLPEFRGRGAGSAAQSLLVGYLFETTATPRIEAWTDVDNVAERRALEKAGLVREGVLRSTQFRAGGWRDVVVYSVLRTEWQERAG
jgi:RimJ/RimL family protein N-acetyltransferase